MTNPWWYSGDEATDRSKKAPAIDLTVLATGAQALVELARGTLFASHADHALAADQPQCLLCRAQVAFGDPTARTGDVGKPVRRVVQWLPIDS